ncbi:MAG: tetratricopeptide repeat protein [Deltaproteobacteria bacterium]|nr:tetratricopeptide repeat protein [Deltaproteobacteria bacterium]
MNIVEKIKNLLQEGELYHTQGLLNEASASYDKAIELIKGNEQLKGNKNLIDGILKKKGALERDIEKVETADQSPEVSAKVQDLIKKMFAFSPDGEDEDKTALDGAIALAKFGQYERALEEFNELIKKDSLRIVAAKNIIRCHMEISGADDSVAQYEEWRSGDILNPGQLEKLRIFINAILQKEDTGKTIPKEEAPAPEKAVEMSGPVIEGLEIEEEEDDDEIIDINSVGITLPSGSQKGQMVELNVSFQHGNVISLVIEQKDKELAECFEVDATLDDVQFYSPIAMFNGTGVISSKIVIESGPRRGDYSVDIKVVSS